MTTLAHNLLQRARELRAKTGQPVELKSDDKKPDRVLAARTAIGTAGLTVGGAGMGATAGAIAVHKLAMLKPRIMRRDPMGAVIAGVGGGGAIGALAGKAVADRLSRRLRQKKEMSAKHRAVVEFLFRRREEQRPSSVGSKIAGAAGLATGAAAAYGIGSYLRGAGINATQRPRTMAKLPLLKRVGTNVATGHTANVDALKGAVSGLLKRVQGLRRFAQEDPEIARRLVEFSRSRRGP